MSDSKRRIDFRRLIETLGPVVTLVLLVIATAAIEHYRDGTDSFLKLENVLNILRQWAFVGIIALGMTFVIICGGIDLSVGSLVAFCGGIGIWVMNTAIDADMIIQQNQDSATIGIPLPFSAFRAVLARWFIHGHISSSEKWGVFLAVVSMLLVGLLAGTLNGLLIAKGRIAPFIATLGGLAAYRSLALAIADGGEFRSSSENLFGVIGTAGVPIPFTELSPGVPLTLPYSVIVFLVLAVLMAILLNKTRYGRYVYAVGCNERAARYSAINVNWIKIRTYMLIGLMTGIAALLVSSRMNSVASSTTGSLYELDVIAAVVIGGTRMSGGAGSIFGTIVGVLILGVISNMLNFLGVSPYLQGSVKGGIIVLAALLQQIGRKSD